VADYVRVSPEVHRMTEYASVSRRSWAEGPRRDWGLIVETLNEKAGLGGFPRGPEGVPRGILPSPACPRDWVLGINDWV
jgi:hypothetical protein